MLKDLLTENRSCRTFDESRAVTVDELRDMVDCARLTPSSVNLQPLCYRLVYTDEELAAVQPLTKWAGALPQLHLPPEGHRPRAFIVICQDTAKFGSADKFLKDVGICALAIQLRACEMGLAGCMIGSYNKAALASVLKLPESVVPLLVVGIGKPDEERRITEVRDDQTRYYRDETNVHYVPKRSLSDIIL
ncbi:MAG: nitroreductase family protein [Clostridia bacterium]|nr:nitroreductase family protein [Clostridia bacterium]